MINTKELRLGNLFANIEDNSIYKVTKINEDSIEGICINNMGWFGEKHFHLIEQVLPIRLTEEWLLKFGFGQMRNKFYKKHVTLTKSEGFYVAFVQDELKSVHQLQNLYFALTGEELALKESLHNNQITDGK